MKKHYFGLMAEYFVALLYRVKFYQILYHRIRNYAGEIDLIAIRGKNIVFIEVKARNKEIYGDNLLGRRQQLRVKNAAQVFLSNYPKYQNYTKRFDLVIVRSYKLPMIIKNAW